MPITNENKIKKYSKSLRKELKKLVINYQNRIKQNLKDSTKHLPDSKAAIIISLSTTIGTAIGSIIPGLGNLIGAAIGASIGAAVVGIIKGHYARMKKHNDNANNIINKLNLQNKETIGPENEDKTGLNSHHIDETNKKSSLDEMLEEVADKVIMKRKDKIMNLKNSQLNRKLVTKYLALNMMAALKHSSNESKDKNNDIEQIMEDDVKKPLSNKMPSVHFITKNNKPKTLKSILRTSNESKDKDKNKNIEPIVKDDVKKPLSNKMPTVHLITNNNEPETLKSILRTSNELKDENKDIEQIMEDDVEKSLSDKMPSVHLINNNNEPETLKSLLRI